MPKTHHQMVVDRKYWDEYWAKRAAKRAVALGLGMIIVTRCESRLQIACPYDPLFIELAKGAGATWRHRSSTWSFPSGQWITALRAIVQCFGRGKLTPDWEHYLETETKHE